MTITERASDLWEKGKKKQEGKYLCYFCDVRYFRRDQYEVWHITQDVHGFHYEKQKIRICLDCASKDRPKKFSRTLLDAKTSGGRL